MQVELIAHTDKPEQKCIAAIRQCYSDVGAEDLLRETSSEKIKELIEMVVKSGHTSTLEHATFTFAVEGISRACSHQLVRHRLASYSQQSQRYVEASNFKFVTPPDIKANTAAHEIFIRVMKQIAEAYSELQGLGIKKEDARFVLPNACETKMVITMNARELLEVFFLQRLCNRAQWEIRALAEKMLKLVKEIAPNIFFNAGPSCSFKAICFEEKTCGRYKKEGAVHISTLRRVHLN